MKNVGHNLRSLKEFLEHISGLGFNPKTVIDVGVAWGTPELYNQFPNAYFALVEAIPAFEKDLVRILNKLNGEYHLKAAGENRECISVAVNMNPASLAGTNVLEKPKLGEKEFLVEVDTLDNILMNTPVKDGALLKLDVQGADLRALHGAKKILEKCEIVVVEASFINAKNKIRDIINYMFNEGFELYEVLGGLYRPYDNAHGQVDLAFVKSSSLLISYKSWS